MKLRGTILKARLVFGGLLAALLGTTLPAAQSNDELWKLAADSYQAGHIETGHLHLKAMIEQSPSDMEVALKALAEILKQSRRSDAILRAEQPNVPFSDNPSAEHAARELCALERIGVISANHASVHQACTILVHHHLHRGRLFEAREMVDRFAQENSHDLFWRLQQAQVYRQLDSTEARPLFDKLKDEMDLDHPDPATRRQWIAFSQEGELHGPTLPRAILPLFKGSPLPYMEPDDPDQEWDLVATRSPRQVTEIIDRLAAKALNVPQIVPWRDKSGLTDPVRALDQHLLHQPKADLKALRAIQEDRYELEKIGPDPSDAQILTRFRRFPWAPSAHQQLLALANRALFAGHAHAALRSFQDLLDHAIDPETTEAAQVGLWTARSLIERPKSAGELLGVSDPTRELSWLGVRTKAEEICRKLIENLGKTTEEQTASSLQELAQHILHLPPVSPWASELPSEIDLAVQNDDLLISGREMLVMYDARQPSVPRWSHSQPTTPGENKKPDKNHPGYFRPQFDEGSLFTRWGFSSHLPRGIAALDRATGELLWNDETNVADPRPRNVPLGDPISSDGLLYYLEWSSLNDVNQGPGRHLNLVCYDPVLRALAWRSRIAMAGHESDLTATLERAQPASSIYGNRITVHQGAIYSSSNSGMVVRSDVRDGRSDWVYQYNPVPIAERSVLNHGSPPLVIDDKVICMPKDAKQVFALDQKTGRLLWENSLVLGVQLVGVVDDLLVIQGRSVLAALDATTGEARWYRPAENVIGRAQLLGSSVCVAELDGLHRLNAVSGRKEEFRAWGFSDEKPQNFAIHDRQLYVVTDKPAEAFGRRINQPLNASLPNVARPLGLPLARAWSLPRENAKITIAPNDSELRGSAYVFSQGILERIDLTSQGRIRWQRFIDGHDPKVQIIGKMVLVIDYSVGRAPGMKNNLIAFDASNGKTLWELGIDAPVQSTLTVGSTQIFHDSIGRIVAVDLTTGERAWERNLGNGFQMRLASDGSKLHVFFVSRLRAAQHIMIDPPTGSTLGDRKIAAKTSADARNAKMIAGGYYEVAIAPVKARYLRLTALSEINGRGWASIAELQVVGANGENLPRKGWAATASNSETKARYDTRPFCVIDDDPITWWHSQWVEGIPPHPHSVTIDMKAEQSITAVRYLPAVIVNNNGMIREYNLHVSNDGQNWGTAVGEGFMVNQTRVDHAYATGKSIVFESRASPNQPLNVYRYNLDGTPALLVQRNTHVLYMQDPYFMTHVGDKLVVHRFDDPGYKFELGPHAQFDLASLELENDRLIMGHKSVIVADLAQKRFIVAPGDPNQTHNKDGLLIRDATDHLIKIVPQGEKGQAVFRFNLQSGQRTDSVLTEQTDNLQLSGGIQHFDGLVLLKDSSSVSAWIGAH